MTNYQSDTVELASRVQEELSGSGLMPAFAKLYSEHTLREIQRPGLAGWRPGELNERFEDALRLVDAAFVLKDAGRAQWRQALRRSGELFEWLSHPNLTTDVELTRLLAAASYQVSGFPARASGLLRDFDTQTSLTGDLVRAVLKPDFNAIESLLIEHWRAVVGKQRESEPSMSVLIRDRMLSCIGLICAEARWGLGDRLDDAIAVMRNASKGLLHSDQTYDWLLAKLLADIFSEYRDTFLRQHLRKVAGPLSGPGRLALERYARINYQGGKALLWPSQIRGLDRIVLGDSFALTTPTGSGKTTVAEVAIIESLFRKRAKTEDAQGPLALYLVPSRALAAEVEAKLSRILRSVTPEFWPDSVKVTGLYGGTDWGPTDAWMTASEPTVLVCTYEKGEALIRFLGTLFMHRLCLIVLDEAHSVQFDNRMDSLRESENRSLRLETLISRILARVDRQRCRIVALSAVASGFENELAGWITGSASATPEKVSYRSTRQLVGRLMCMRNGRSEIRYDILDGNSLEFDNAGERERPYVPGPFPPMPNVGTSFTGTEKRMRPYVLWAAMHLAAPDETEHRRSVLVSVTEHIGSYAESLLQLLDGPWAEATLPDFFSEPVSDMGKDLWRRCLAACEDYFGLQSREYRLLKRGIVVHHGRMPGLMARLLVQVIDERLVSFVIATSTLSEGVNLPFETVLLPTVRRNRDNLSPSEFANLVGRAGRPGFGVEGKTLVAMPTPEINTTWQEKYAAEQNEEGYFGLLEALRDNPQIGQRVPSSPLAALITELESTWQGVAQSTSRDGFLRWLETVVESDLKIGDANGPAAPLDVLDGILLSSIVESEGIGSKELSPLQMEQELMRFWQNTYARYASNDEEWLGTAALTRAKALVNHVYPTKGERKQVYATSLTPRFATELVQLHPAIKKLLIEATDYAIWDPSQRLQYVTRLVRAVNTITKFRLPDLRKNSKTGWEDILEWWLDHDSAEHSPTVTQISSWHDYVSKSFNYRFNWGWGSLMALSFYEDNDDELRTFSLEQWPSMGLPWLAFWLKELVVWGTLEPVAAYLLGRGLAETRKDAADKAQGYYAQALTESPNELLNPSLIRAWSDTLSQTRRATRGINTEEIEVELTRDFSRSKRVRFHVYPVQSDLQILWLDPSGAPLARSNRPGVWPPAVDTDFVLLPNRKAVRTRRYV